MLGFEKLVISRIITHIYKDIRIYAIIYDTFKNV